MSDMLFFMRGNVVVPLITPKNHWDFVSLVNHVLNGGVRDLLFFGTTGEGSTISLEQKKALIREVVPAIESRAQLYVGLLDPVPAANVELASFCSDLGFSAALVPVRSLSTLHRVQLPIILYNLPTSPVDLPEIVDHVSKKTIGIKESSGDVEAVRMLITSSRSDRFKVYYGREQQIEQALDLEIDGFFPSTGNIQPDVVMRLWERRDEAALRAFSQAKKAIFDACPNNYIQGIKHRLLQMNILTK